jgi:hypothetical protein
MRLFRPADKAQPWCRFCLRAAYGPAADRSVVRAALLSSWPEPQPLPLRPHFLALEHHVARHEQQDGRGHEADDLGPHDEHALQQVP